MSNRTFWWLSAAALVLVWAGAPAQTTNLLPNGSFESGKPSFWHADSGTVAGTKLTWAKDQKHSGTHSLKIEKPTAGDTARWYSDNNVRYWVDNIPKGVDIKLGAWVKTSGVNTSPAATGKWQIKVAFYDTLGAMIGSAPFALDVDQTTASRDWYADTNGVGTVNLPKTAFKMVMSAEGGPNATGTVWFDDFIFVGRGGAWAGQNWNGNVDADSGWQYWIGPNGGNDALTDFPGTGVTDSIPGHTGKYSLRISANPGRATSEAVFFSETVPIPPNSKDKQYVLSAWVKTSNIVKDSAKNPSSSLGFTVTWQTKMFADAGGWNEGGSNEQHIILNNESQDWTQYSMLLTVPDNNITAISVRPRAYNLFTGVSFWDDFGLVQVTSVSTSVRPGPDPIAGMVPAAYELGQNYPNPFNPSTKFRFSLPNMQRVSVKVFDVIGREVAVLVNEQLQPGTYTVEWNAGHVPSGVYFYRIDAGGYTAVKKMLLLK